MTYQDRAIAQLRKVEIGANTGALLVVMGSALVWAVLAVAAAIEGKEER